MSANYSRVDCTYFSVKGWWSFLTDFVILIWRCLCVWWVRLEQHEVDVSITQCDPFSLPVWTSQNRVLLNFQLVHNSLILSLSQCHFLPVNMDYGIVCDLANIQLRNKIRDYCTFFFHLKIKVEKDNFCVSNRRVKCKRPLQILPFCSLKIVLLIFFSRKEKGAVFFGGFPVLYVCACLCVYCRQLCH